MMTLEYLGNPPTTSDKASRPLSPAVRAGDFVFISGQVPVDENGIVVVGGIEAQTHQVMKNLHKVLQLVDASFEDVCKATIFLEDARDFPACNQVYKSYFGANCPARSTVEARLMIDAKVEIDLVVYKPKA